MRLDIRDVSYNYSNNIPVLKNINISMESPNLVCVVGPNGVGKSTLIKCINGLLKPDHGNISIDGRDVREFDKKELAMTVGYVPPKTTDMFSMPVIDAIMVGRHNLQGWRNTSEDLEKISGILGLLNIEGLAMRPFNSLSSGQHQKVSIARGLAQETPILLLDEPTSNLDVKHQVYVTEMLRAIAKTMNKLIIMISHDLNIAAKYADMIVVMSSPGIVYNYGTPSEVITEDMVRSVYGIDCKVVDADRSPHVVLGFVLSD